MFVAVLTSWNAEKSEINGVSKKDLRNQNTYYAIDPLLKFQWNKQKKNGYSSSVKLVDNNYVCALLK